MAMPLTSPPTELVGAFQQRYGCNPAIYSFAPGRLNFIGEHVDYLGGHVVPAAINFGCHVVIAFSESSESAEPARHWEFTFASLEVDADKSPVSFALGEGELTTADKRGKSLTTIVRGAMIEAQWLAAKLATEYSPETVVTPKKVQGLISSSIPIGAGLSSSAALCVSLIQGALRVMLPQQIFDSLATAHFTQHASTHPQLDQPFHKYKNDVAKAAQRVENVHCGMNCGIMDQYASIHGEANTILEVDCASMSHKAVPLFTEEAGGYQVLLVNSMRAHDLGSNYNEVRADLESAEKKINHYLKEKKGQTSFVTLREMAGQSFDGSSALTIIDNLLHNEDFISALNTREHGRARYAVSEMERVQTFVAIAASSTSKTVKISPVEILRSLGALLTKTHEGLSKQLLVSTEELDQIVSICAALGTEKVYGARLMGGGFGGCALVLANSAQIEEIQQTIQNQFAAAFPELGPCAVYKVSLCEGATATYI